jgi:hypothetical protein
MVPDLYPLTLECDPRPERGSESRESVLEGGLWLLRLVL